MLLSFIITENKILLISALLAQRAKYQPLRAEMRKCQRVRNNKVKNPDQQKGAVSNIKL